MSMHDFTVFLAGLEENETIKFRHDAVRNAIVATVSVGDSHMEHFFSTKEILLGQFDMVSFNLNRILQTLRNHSA